MARLYPVPDLFPYPVRDLSRTLRGMADRTRWLPISEAARALGVTERAVRRRVARGTLETRREVVGNRSRTLVRVPVRDAVRDPEAERVQDPGPDPRDVELAALRATMAAQAQHLADLRAELERRRWPGLWPALTRFWSGKR